MDTLPTRSSFTFPFLVLAFAALATPFVARAGEGCKPVHGFYTSTWAGRASRQGRAGPALTSAEPATQTCCSTAVSSSPSLG